MGVFLFFITLQKSYSNKTLNFNRKNISYQETNTKT